MPVFARARDRRPSNTVWFGLLLVAAACSSKDGIDFFEPSDDGSATGGMSGTSTGGMPSGGSAGDGGTVVTGGSAGDASGGTGANPTGGSSGDTGGTDAQGGSDAGTGGMPPAGGSGGDAGDGGNPMGGSAGAGMAGSGGDGMSGAGMGGAGMGGAGAGGAGTGGAGMGGAGKGGAGKGGAAGTAGTSGAGGCMPMTPELCDGLDNNCMGGIDEGNACPANCTGATFGGHTYLFCSFEDAPSSGSRLRTWTQAMDFCTMRQHSLVFVESEEENEFVLAWIEKLMLEDDVWMGANDRDGTIGSNEGEWVWGTGNNAVQFWDGDADGDPVMNRYNDWAEGEPNNGGNEDCGVWASNHDYRWDDRSCTETQPNFVCESTGP